MIFAFNFKKDFTYNKALQKITESLKVDRKIKKRIRTMKRGPVRKSKEGESKS